MGLYIFVALQIVTALGLIVLTAVTTTKSEQGSGFGWGTIGGKSSTSIAGLEDQRDLRIRPAQVAELVDALA